MEEKSSLTDEIDDVLPGHFDLDGFNSDSETENQNDSKKKEIS